MTINCIQISIITLTKNNCSNFLKTLKSIKSQNIKYNIEWLIIDGSKEEKLNKNKYYIKQNLKKENNIFVKHINALKIKIEGIYPCMNYGKQKSRGRFIIFLNSGDTFFNKDSLNKFFNSSLSIDSSKGIIFGQAKIIANKKISWIFPSKRLKNIKLWLRFFEPNHQSMLIASKLAKSFDFPLQYNILADGYWKRKILNNASDIFYINSPLVNFFLDGVSASRPSKKLFKELMLNKNLSFRRKIIFFIKYNFPRKIFFLFYLMQKFKSNLVDLLF